MRIIRFLLVILICLISASCQPIEYNPNDTGGNGNFPNNSPFIPVDVIDGNLPYEEEADSLEGLSEEEINDLSALKNALDSINSNYTSKTRVFFNALAVDRVNTIYNTNFYCQQTRLYNTNYIYRYSEDFGVNTAYANYNDSVYKLSLVGNDLNQKFNNPINLDTMTVYKENEVLDDYFFTLNDVNSDYVDKYSWTRVSVNKYKSSGKAITNEFIKLCVPGFDNDGTYMTFDYVTIEINPDDENILRLRLYASSTQIGKLINSHTKPSNENWFLLFAEAYISRIDQTEIFAFENLLNE